MILKEYQKRTLATVREFLEGLAEWRGKAAAALEAVPELDLDWVRKAWEKSVPARVYHPRRNGRRSAKGLVWRDCTIWKARSLPIPKVVRRDPAKR